MVDTAWVMDVVEGEGWCHFEPEIGSADLKGADTTTLPKMSAACAVEPAAPEQR